MRESAWVTCLSLPTYQNPPPFSQKFYKNADREPQCEMQDEGKEVAHDETVVDIDKVISSGYSKIQ
jgi:hypothetical protein